MRLIAGSVPDYNLERIMNSILSWMGGKSLLAKQIVERIPSIVVTARYSRPAWVLSRRKNLGGSSMTSIQTW
jgi:hypothetical protein